MKPWRIKSSRTSYEDKWLKIRSDRCETAEGRIIDPFHIIEAPEWVCVLGLTADNQVLAIREYRHGAQAITLGLPGGACDPEDQSISMTAARELEEETGYRCSTLVCTGCAYANWANQNNQISFFIGFDATPVGIAHPDPNEEIDPVLIPYADFLAYDFDGPKQTHHAAALFYAERYFSKHPARRPGP
ncbi:MAG: NUDIX hydrolase [Henriciella sp.]|uniref:NUDIX hydrolase n=1 Tax=Henriciella sp. TaxID=1968823 RepID=UPI003C793C90